MSRDDARGPGRRVLYGSKQETRKQETRRKGRARERVEEQLGVATLRRLLLALVLLGCAGLLGELLLLEHYETVWQWVPLVVIALALLTGAMMLLRPGRLTVRIFQVVMLSALVSGIVGLWLHFAGNRAFELEMDPELGGVGLFWLALRGATPALAPGAMIQLALIGLIAAYRHPGTAGHSHLHGGST